MTADVLDRNLDSLRTAGVNGCLEKPFTPEALFNLLAERLGEESVET